MKKLQLVFVILFLICLDSFSQQVEKVKILGTWKIKSFDTIDFIRSSPEYTSGSKEQKDEIDKMVDLLLDNTLYYFKDQENLTYTDVQGDKIVEKKAIYNINEDGYLFCFKIFKPSKLS